MNTIGRISKNQVIGDKISYLEDRGSRVYYNTERNSDGSDKA